MSEDEPDLEESIDHFQESDDLEIREVVTSLSRDTENSKFGGDYHSPCALTLRKYPPVGLDICASTILQDYLHTRFPEPNDVQKEAQLLETHPLVDVVNPGYDTKIDFVFPPKTFQPIVGTFDFKMCRLLSFETKPNYFRRIGSTHFLKEDHLFHCGQLCESNLIDLEDPQLFRLLLCASKFLFEFFQTLIPEPDLSFEEIQPMKTFYLDPFIEPEPEPQLDVVVLNRKLDKGVLYLLIFLACCRFLLLVIALFGFDDPQIFRLLLYDFIR